MPDSTTTADHAEHITRMRDAIAVLHTQEPNPGHECLSVLVDFAERHGLYFADDTQVNLWGFGTAPIVLSEPDGGYWLRLLDLAEPTGLTGRQLCRIFRDELAEQQEQEGDADHPTVLDIHTTGGRDLLVHNDFVVRVFAIHSPWRSEFQRNTEQLMAHGLEKSGLLDTIGQSPTGFTVIAHLTTDDGEAIKLSMPVLRFDVDQVPIVLAPFDDAVEGEEMRVTTMTGTYEVHRADDAVRAVLGPTIGREEAVRRAYRGPSLP